MAEYSMGKVKDLKKGSVAVIDDEPCKVQSISISRPGKHGHAKARVKSKSLINGSSHGFVKPVDDRLKFPKVIRKEAQIIADMGDTVQLMDMETYENFELKKPDELKDKLQQGQTVEVKKVMDHQEINRIVED